jgi:catechol 2,3-dioxygenase-like lactoylglutathione lyase family enzyme
MREVMVFERYAFVAVTTNDLARARRFWEGLLGCAVVEQREAEYFIVNAGGLRLCIEAQDGNVHRLGGTDPTIGLRVNSVPVALAELRERGLVEAVAPVTGSRGTYAIIHDPEGRSIILSEFD